MPSPIDTLLIAMMERPDQDAGGIQHFVKVYSFARLIGQMERLPADVQETLEAAAVVHDIGIPAAQQKYGSSSGHYQELEGPPLARALLERLGWEEPVIRRVEYLVGRHHTYTDIDGIDYQILVEADFLVNLFENGAGSRREVYCCIFKTEGGKRLFRAMFPADQPEPPA